MFFILLYLEAARFPLLLRWGLGIVGGEHKRAGIPWDLGHLRKKKVLMGKPPQAKLSRWPRGL